MSGGVLSPRRQFVIHGQEQQPFNQDQHHAEVKQEVHGMFMDHLKPEGGDGMNPAVNENEMSVEKPDVMDQDSSTNEAPDLSVPCKSANSKRDRTNRVMSKIKPKSPTAILNEMSSSHTYDFTMDGTSYRATLHFDNQEFFGTGTSKAAAQTEAAEEAIKQIVLQSDMQQLKASQLPMLTYPQLLSYSLYKLLITWNPSGTQVVRMQSSSSVTSTEVRPAKKFPPNPERLHPVMLLSQTHPHAKFIEVAMRPPPNVSFTIECVVDERKFLGTGQSKKDAKKRAATLACIELLDVKYPLEEKKDE